MGEFLQKKDRIKISRTGAIMNQSISRCNTSGVFSLVQEFHFRQQSLVWTKSLIIFSFSTSRLLPSLGEMCTSATPWILSPTICPLLGSTWVETPPYSSVTCCWATRGSTTVKSRVGESTTGAKSTSLYWVSVDTSMHLRIPLGYEEIHLYMENPHTQTHIHTLLTHTDLITGSLAWHISSVMLTDLMIQFDSDSVIWFCSCCLGPFGLVCWWGETRNMQVGLAGHRNDWVRDCITWANFKLDSNVLVSSMTYTVQDNRPVWCSSC